MQKCVLAVNVFALVFACYIMYAFVGVLPTGAPETVWQVR